MGLTAMEWKQLKNIYDMSYLHPQTKRDIEAALSSGFPEVNKEEK